MFKNLVYVLACVVIWLTVGAGIGYAIDDYMNLHRRLDALEQMISTYDVVIEIPDSLFNVDNN